MSTYFITGATGAVGSAIVERLLADRDAELRLLIRAGSEDELQHRLKTLLEFCGGAHDEVAHRIAGDASLPMFGLAENAYRRLASECTHIIHCAGAVRMNLAIADARKSAVESARAILSLSDSVLEARSRRPKTEFISTVGVGGRLPGTVPEQWITTARTFHNTYEQAKAEAEDLIRPAVESGHPITVHRPSMVVGHSRTGKIIHYQVFYHLAEFLSGRRTRGLFPTFGETRLDLVAADHVAEAIVWSSQSPSSVGHILHLCAGPDGAIPIRELRAKVAEIYGEQGLPIPRAVTLPSPVFLGLARVLALGADAKTKKALSTLPVFLDYLSSNQRFANASTRKTLNAAGIEFPSSSVLVSSSLRHYLQTRAAGSNRR
jgi:thioester reductase-like protein